MIPVRKPWLVGELNPYGPDPNHRAALFPHPRKSAGYRLCAHILGLDRKVYLDAFNRRNLCTLKWEASAAAVAAKVIVAESQGEPLVLFGRKVMTAFGYKDAAFFSVVEDHGQQLVMLPHPSGLSREWNKPGTYQRARDLVLPLIRYMEV